MTKEVAIFAGGCFWGIEDEFSKMRGVIETEAGYSGGKIKHPTYTKVCSGKTGHAESVKVVFDNKKLKYGKLLDKFWSIHDPTTLNRQGPDIGTQYRSAIFYTNAKQKEAAEKSKKSQEKKIGKKIVTQIKKALPFYKAEEYHQKYFNKKKGGIFGWLKKL